MSELRSIVDRLRMEELAELPDARLEEDFDELQRAGDQLEVERLRRLAEIDRRRVFERHGSLSTVSWLAGRFRMAWGAAREHVRMARGLREMPETRRALEEGAVSMSAARVLVNARDADPGAFQGAEHQLVEAARIHTMGDLNKVAAYWQQAAEREAGLEGEEKLRERRRLHASATFMGMVRVDGDLDPETGEAFLTALRAVMDVDARSGGKDERTPAQRRADALYELCRQWLDQSDRPKVAGERPHVMVTVGAEVLRDREGQPSEMTHTGPVNPETARRMACDASLRRVVMAGPSEPLDIGRRTSVVPPALRRAVVMRDRHCRFPHCDKPEQWCDAHHGIHWADGGPTAASNLVLLCRPHHRECHRRGITVTMEGGGPVFRRPDGTVLEDRAPP
jgi:hypothetical protein